METLPQGWWVGVLAFAILAFAGGPRPPANLEGESPADDVVAATSDVSTADSDDDDEPETARAAASDDGARKCRNGCNSRCHGAGNKSKCVNQCRRACDGR
ncbi:MAG: hypothetical protein JNK82_21945 [Myxococcaceae bacterium]|nr:hypothetical protein [Myxococcaceae bacterium]